MLTEHADIADIRDALIKHGAPIDAAGTFYRYLHDGIPPGDFIMGVLENDLMKAMSHADSDRARLFLPNYCYFLYNELPTAAWGSKAAVKAWIVARHEDTRRMHHQPPVPL